MTRVLFDPPPDFAHLPLELAERSVPFLFERAVERFAERVALRERGRNIRYGELNAAANALAHALLARCGEGTEPIVFVLGHNAAAVTTLLGIMKTGRPYLPLNPSLPAERIKQIATESGAPLILTDNANLAQVQTIVSEMDAVGILNVDEIDSAANRDNPGLAIDPSRPACILYTSGSTGEPKGIVTSHRYISFSTVSDINFYCITPRDRITLLNTISFSGSRTSMFGALLSGATLCIYDVRADGPEGAAQWMLDEQVTDFRAIAPIFRLIFSNIPEGVVIPSLRCVGLGGDTVRASDIELFRTHTASHCLFRNGLASTECGVIAEYFLRHADPISGEVVPVGYSAAGKEVSIVDDSGAPLPDGEVGEIVVKSRYLASGYWRSAELTAKKFLADPRDPQMQIFYSGDRGRINADGALEHLGRLDNQVKVRGNRVDVSEIERALHQMPEARDAVVHAWPSPANPQERQLAAYVVLREQTSLASSDIRQRLAGQLPNYMVPAFILLMDALPVNANGKVDRRALPEPRRSSAASQRAPANAAEEKLLAIWQKRLGLDDLSVDENFFELGGDSLMAANIFADIERAFGKRYPPNLLLTHGSVHALAGLLLSGATGPARRLVPLRASGALPPLFAVPGAGSDVITLLELTESLGADQPVYGLQDFDVESQSSIYQQGLARAAAEYVRAIKTIQPQGPYHLIGHSFGGMVAFEMARQLRAEGEAVGLLGLLDTFPPSQPSRKGTWGNRVRTHWTNLRRLDAPGKWGYVTRRLKRSVFRLAAREPLRRIFPSKLVQKILGEDAIRYVRASLADYRPGPYEGRAVVYRATSRPAAVTWDVTAPWRDFILGGVEFRDVPGQHRSIVKQPNVEALARWLKEDLAGAN